LNLELLENPDYLVGRLILDYLLNLEPQYYLDYLLDLIILELP
jgi:hypothetical protein